MPCTSRPAVTCAAVTSSAAVHDVRAGKGDAVSPANGDDDPADDDETSTATPAAAAAAAAARARATAASTEATVPTAAAAPTSVEGDHDLGGLPTVLPLPPPPRLPRRRRRDDRRVTGQADAQQERDGGDAYAPSSQEASAPLTGLPGPSSVPAEEAAEAPSPHLEGDTSHDTMSMDIVGEGLALLPPRTAPRSITLTGADGLVDEDRRELGRDGPSCSAAVEGVSAASKPTKSSLAPTTPETTAEGHSTETLECH